MRPEFVSLNCVWKIKLQLFPDKFFIFVKKSVGEIPIVFDDSRSAADYHLWNFEVWLLEFAQRH